MPWSSSYSNISGRIFGSKSSELKACTYLQCSIRTSYVLRESTKLITISLFSRKKADLNIEGQFLIRQIYDDEITYNVISAAVEILSELNFYSENAFRVIFLNFLQISQPMTFWSCSEKPSSNSAKTLAMTKFWKCLAPLLETSFR